MEGLFLTKSNVYSFGFLLLEIIIGRKNSAYYRDSPSMSLVRNVSELNVCCITFFFLFFTVS